MVNEKKVSTHMPLARHDIISSYPPFFLWVSTHMPLARHDDAPGVIRAFRDVSTHMPLARHDFFTCKLPSSFLLFLLTCLLRGMTGVKIIIGLCR